MKPNYFIYLLFLLVCGFIHGQEVRSVTVKFTDTCQQQLSISENSHSPLKIYPNPTSDHLYIQTNEIVNTCELVDSHGRILLVSSTKKDYIDLSMISSGMYILRIKTNRHTHTHKIIIKR